MKVRIWEIWATTDTNKQQHFAARSLREALEYVSECKRLIIKTYVTNYVLNDFAAEVYDSGCLCL